MKGDFEEDSAFAAVLARCRKLAEGFKTRAARYDETGEFPAKNFEELRRAGLLKLTIPRKFGGMGAGLLGWTLASERLARGDASTALNLAQHCIILGGLCAQDDARLKGTAGQPVIARRRRLFAEVVKRGKLFASATSEPQSGFRPSRVKTRYRSVKGGFRLNGLKSFVSMAGHANYYFLPAVSEEAGEVSYFAVPAKTRGLKVERAWDALGMRATASHNLRLRDCVVAREALVGGIEGLAVAGLIRRPEWAAGGFNGVYLGLAGAALEEAAAYLNGRTKSGESAPLSADSVIQHEMGRLSVEFEAARALVYHAAALADRRPGSPEANAAIFRAKYLVCETAPRLASEAMRICGGNSLRREHPLGRIYRDARCGSLMSASSHACLAYAGRAALGLDLRSLDAAPW